jgi:hypothetical protein
MAKKKISQLPLYDWANNLSDVTIPIVNDNATKKVPGIELISLFSGMKVRGNGSLFGILGITGVGVDELGFFPNIDPANGWIYDGDLTDSIQFSSRYMSDGHETSLDWGQRALFDSTGVAMLNWNNKKLFSNNGYVSLDWSNKWLASNDESITLNWGTCNLFDNANDNISVDWENRQLYNFTEDVSVDWGNWELYSSDGSTSVDWNSRQLIDNSFNQSINWEQRKLYRTNGSVAFDWQNQTRFIETIIVFSVNGSGVFTIHHTIVNDIQLDATVGQFQTTSAGNYLYSLSVPKRLDKVSVRLNPTQLDTTVTTNKFNSGSLVTVNANNVNQIRIRTMNSAGTTADGLLSYAELHIRYYD